MRGALFVSLTLDGLIERKTVFGLHTYYVAFFTLGHFYKEIMLNSNFFRVEGNESLDVKERLLLGV